MSIEFKHGGSVKSTSEVPNVGRVRAQSVAQPFNYLFPDLATDANSTLPGDDPATTIEQLMELGSLMADNDSPADDSSIAPVYTYLGQFIDHDISLTVFDQSAGLPDIFEPFSPVPPAKAAAGVSNGRRAFLDLDCLYGDGPTFDGEASMSEAESMAMFDGPKMKMGMITVDDGSGTIPGEFVPPMGDLQRDVPRKDNLEPLIADKRNDENTIVAQLHTGFLRFHNALVDGLDSGSIKAPELDASSSVQTKGYYDDVPGGMPGSCGGQSSRDRILFEQASTLARRHYQWIVLHDFLKTIGKATVVEQVLADGPKHYKPSGAFPFMPFEHSVAAYRFGHSMVRHEYNFNRNFNPTAGSDGSTALAPATFDLLFQFTGKGGMRGAPSLPFNWVAEWDRLVDAEVQSARKIDTRLASDLANMSNEVEPDALGDLPPIHIQDLLKHLAQRNLLRSYLFSIPTGQAMAARMGFAPLSSSEMQANNSNELNTLLVSSGFLEHTPAWYYVLKEAEVREDGNSLGEVGTAIIAETFVGLLLADKHSILNEAKAWTPEQGVGVTTIAELLEFSGVLPPTAISEGKSSAVPA